MGPPSPIPTIPKVDISPFLQPSPPPLRHSTAAQISLACTTPGFFHLTHHNLPSHLTTRVLDLARSFFLHASSTEKARIARSNVGEVDNDSGRYGDGARGYQVVGENVTGGKRDWHEAVDWYRPVREGEPFESVGNGDEGDEDEEEGDTHRKLSSQRNISRNRPGPYPLLHGLNAWPTYPSDFRPVYEEYVSKMLDLGTAVVRAMGVALGNGMEDVFVGNTRKSAWVMRAIGYPPLPLPLPEHHDDGEGMIGRETNNHENDGATVSCGAHSDYGCVTLLLADGTKGALQAWVEGEGEEGRWVDVDPVEGALVVNIGDMMERWSGGKWKATRHRVVHKGKGFRVSVPFFFEPDWDARVPGREGEGGVVYGEYLEGKVRGNF